MDEVGAVLERDGLLLEDVAVGILQQDGGLGFAGLELLLGEAHGDEARFDGRVDGRGEPSRHEARAELQLACAAEGLGRRPALAAHVGVDVVGDVGAGVLDEVHVFPGEVEGLNLHLVGVGRSGAAHFELVGLGVGHFGPVGREGRGAYLRGRQLLGCGQGQSSHEAEGDLAVLFGDGRDGLVHEL